MTGVNKTNITSEVFRDMVDEQMVVYNWQQIDQKRRQKRPIPFRHPLVFSVVFVLLGAGTFAAYHLSIDATSALAPLSFELSESTRIFSVPAKATAVRRIPFSDGSSIALTPGASLEVKENKPNRFLTSLHKGWVRYNVIPERSRTWEVDTGGCRIIVLGTQFTLNRTPNAVHIAVHRGSVAVYPLTDDKILATLSAGERYTLRLPEQDTPQCPPHQPLVAHTTQNHLPQNDASKERRTQRTGQQASRANSTSTQARNSLTKLGGLGASGAVNQLLERADDERIRNQPQKAVALLERILREYPYDPSVGLVTLTIGTIRLDDLHQPRRAARAFKQAASIKGLPSSLREMAYGRGVEAFQRAGDIASARAMSNQYRRNFPQGAWLPIFERWTESE